MPEKNKIYTAEITGLTSEGSGVCRIEDMAVFVPQTAVGDTAEIKIVKVLSHYAFGIVNRIIVPSPDRAVRECGVYKKCGGCVFRHISYEAECRAKDEIVRDAFQRIGGLSPDFDGFISAENPDRYRNKVQLPVAEINGETICGFYAPRSHRVIPIEKCGLQPCIFDDIISYIRHSPQMSAVSAYDEKTGIGWLRHVYIRQGFHSKEIMVCFVATSEKTSPHFRNMIRGLVNKFSEIKSIVLNVNPHNTNVILGKKCITLYGSDTITDTMCGNKIKISPLSFYQINTAQAEKLYGKALEYANPSADDVIADLYCGAGTIGLSMAHCAKKIIGIEIVPDAVENAKQNALQNDIANAEFYCGDAGEVFGKLRQNGCSPDIIIVDPPRKGCSEDTLKTIVSANPRKIVMISCNPATAARDAKFLAENNYNVNKVCGADLFPATKHVECVVLMSKE